MCFNKFFTIEENAGVAEILNSLAKKELEEQSAIFVDIREPEEFLDGVIEGAIFINLKLIQNGQYNFPIDKKIIFYCRSGVRSLLAMAILKQDGYDAYSLKGGINLWKKEIEGTFL